MSQDISSTPVKNQSKERLEESDNLKQDDSSFKESDVLTLNELIANKDARAKTFETLHFFLYAFLFSFAMKYSSFWRRTYNISIATRVTGIVMLKMLTLEPPVEPSSIMIDLIFEIFMPSGAVLRVGNPQFKPDPSFNDFWKVACHVCCMLTDLGGVTASVASSGVILLLDGITYWFIQIDDYKTNDEIYEKAGAGSYIIRIFWSGPAVIQTFEGLKTLADKSAPGIYYLRNVVHILLLVYNETRLLIKTVSWVWLSN